MRHFPNRTAIMIVILAAALGRPQCLGRESEPRPVGAIVHPGPDGRLVYEKDAQGNRIPDFSSCGYMGGGVAIPDVPVRLCVEPVDGDNRAHVQTAIDKLAALPIGADGFRGALLLKRGTYALSDSIRITTSGIVLRGEGTGDDGTVLVATKRKKHSLVRVDGDGKRAYSPGVDILDDYVPVGARRFRVADASGFAVGDDVEVVRPSTKEWIADIGMDRLRETYKREGTVDWAPGKYNLPFTRRIATIRGDEIEIDAPIVCALERKYGGGSIRKFAQAGRIERVGIENVRGDSVFDASIRDKRRKSEFSDENHAWVFINIANAQNVWVRDCAAAHFGYSMVNVSGWSRWVTVQDCWNRAPVSQVTGGRRYTFAIGGKATQVLMQRCRAERGRHDFVMHARVPGPNVFLDCVAADAYSDSGPHHRWSVGTLYDNLVVRDNAINVQDRGPSGTGHGWAGANQVLWNCRAKSFVVQKPPAADNWAIGCIGERKPGRLERQQGYWEHHGAHVAPRSLYLKQLEDRLGVGAVDRVATSAQRDR